MLENEGKMLKWLKHKPAGHHQHSQGSYDVGQNKIITDDPLATIQVHHPQQKKSKNKSEEIYAVSRVNPLFEEEDVARKASGGGSGNSGNSGSSGYDSGPTSEDELPHKNRLGAERTASTQCNHVVNRAVPKHGQLFQDADDPVVHHQAAILSPNGRPVLHIVEQNPDYVQEIAVAVGNRPLTPIDESSDAKTRVCVHPVPNRSPKVTPDNVGVAKIIHKENRYVRSIVVGTPSSSNAGKAQQPLSRKPTVTFAEKVELVVSDNANRRVILASPASTLSTTTATPYRKQSEDSIVTESLLLMTSSRPVGHELPDTDANNRLSNSSKSASELPERKISSSSSSDCPSRSTVDLEAFSSSIRKNHPVKHILSNNGKSLEIVSTADQYSSTEFLDNQEEYHEKHHVQERHEEDSSSNSDGQGQSYDTDETRSSSIDQEGEEQRNVRRLRAACTKSPFGGIADHYAAAKEIAKEIESYSNGSASATKPNSKKSIVRELLSGRGREALAMHTAFRKSQSSDSSSSTSQSFLFNGLKFSKPDVGTVVGPEALRHAAPLKDPKGAWETVRVQQVCLKGRTWKEIDQSYSSSSSSSSSSCRQEEGDTGQRVLSVIQQGQVHSNKKDSSSSSSGCGTVTSDTTTYTTILQQSSSNKQQQLKSSIYDGHSSEEGTSNNDGDDDASSDSGNSTDRNSKESHLGLLQERRSTQTRCKIPAKPPDPVPPEPGDKPGVSEAANLDKVMLVTGDSQSVVVDLSGIPQELKDAIVSGTALITLPEGLKTSSPANKGSYTIVTIPSQPPEPPESSPVSSNAKKGSSSPDVDINEIKVVPSALEKVDNGPSEVLSQIFNSYGTKNKAQVWDVMQQSVQQTLIEGANGRKKRITTVLPFHPNQDVYKSPDFTMEGQRMERQRKKLDIAKKRRCICRVFGIFFFLATFIGVLVALSMIYTKGQRYFGSV